jgi:Rrf2 family protein
MKLSTKTRYAARALTQLASATAPTPVHQLAESQNISEKYLESIMKTLTSAGLVRAIRGNRGGHELARPAECITLRDVFEALEGSLAPVECVDDPARCPRVGTCPTRDTWLQLQESILGVLEQTTIQGLAVRQDAKRSARACECEI